jgi:hypothetical protein
MTEDGRRHDNGDMRMLSLMGYEIRVSMTTPSNEKTECKTCVSYLHTLHVFEVYKTLPGGNHLPEFTANNFRKYPYVQKYDRLYQKHDTDIFSNIPSNTSNVNVAGMQICVV